MAKLLHFRDIRVSSLTLHAINFGLMALTVPNRPVHARKRHVMTQWNCNATTTPANYDHPQQRK
jgi:hypothetical protein